MVLDAGDRRVRRPGKVHTIDHDGPTVPGARARSTRRGPPRAGRCWCRPDRPRAARSSPRGTPRPCSPRSAPSTRGRSSTATSRRVSSSTAAMPTSSRCCPASCRSSRTTEEEAMALEQAFTDLISPEYSLRQLSTMLGVDLTKHALDAPLPPLPPLDEIQGNKSRYQLVKDLAEQDGSLTVRQLIGKLGGGRGHRTFAGHPRTGRRRAADVVRAGRGRRFQHHAALPARRAGGLRRPCRADPAAARSVPHRVHARPPCAVTTVSRTSVTGSRGAVDRSERMSGETGLKPLVTTVFVPAAIFGIGQGAAAPVMALTARELGASVAVVRADRRGRRARRRAGRPARRPDGRQVRGAAVDHRRHVPSARPECWSVCSRRHRWMLGVGALLTGLANAVWGLARQSYLADAVPIGLRARAMSSFAAMWRLGFFVGTARSAPP